LTAPFIVVALSGDTRLRVRRHHREWVQMRRQNEVPIIAGVAVGIGHAIAVRLAHENASFVVDDDGSPETPNRAEGVIKGFGEKRFAVAPFCWRTR
jgi:hypothetical protein